MSGFFIKVQSPSPPSTSSLPISKVHLARRVCASAEARLRPIYTHFGSARSALSLREPLNDLAPLAQPRHRLSSPPFTSGRHIDSATSSFLNRNHVGPHPTPLYLHPHHPHLSRRRLRTNLSLPPPCLPPPSETLHPHPPRFLLASL